MGESRQLGNKKSVFSGPMVGIANREGVKNEVDI